MRRTILSICIFCTGCAPYAQVQTDLTQQIRRGVAMSGESLQSQSAIIKEYHEIQRRRLDQAFDEDVRQRADLSADWIIEHRRAYAAAVDALAQQRSQHARAVEKQQENIAAIDQALQQSIWLQSLPTRAFSSLKEEP